MSPKFAGTLLAAVVAPFLLAFSPAHPVSSAHAASPARAASPAHAGTTVVRPLPAALSGHTRVTASYSAAELYEWRYYPGTTIPVDNGSGPCENSRSPRGVTLRSAGVVLSATGSRECGNIQSPAKIPTASGVVQARVKFSGVGSTARLADWAAMWLYGDNWPANGEIDAVEAQFGTSFVTYHYGTAARPLSASDEPAGWGQAVQLTAQKGTKDITPGWHTVDIAFARHEADVYYDGRLYQRISGAYVTNKPMYLAFTTRYGAGAGLGPAQRPFDVPGSITIASVEVFG